jgi:hypothetical protein
MRFNDYHKSVCEELNFPHADDRRRSTRPAVMRYYAAHVSVSECVDHMRRLLEAEERKEREARKARGLDSEPA